MSSSWLAYKQRLRGRRSPTALLSAKVNVRCRSRWSSLFTSPDPAQLDSGRFMLVSGRSIEELRYFCRSGRNSPKFREIRNYSTFRLDTHDGGPPRHRSLALISVIFVWIVGIQLRERRGNRARGHSIDRCRRWFQKPSEEGTTTRRR